MNKNEYFGQGHAKNYHLFKHNGTMVEIYMNPQDGEHDHINCFFTDHGDPYQNEVMELQVWMDWEELEELRDE